MGKEWLHHHRLLGSGAMRWAEIFRFGVNLGVGPAKSRPRRVGGAIFLSHA